MKTKCSIVSIYAVVFKLIAINKTTLGLIGHSRNIGHHSSILYASSPDVTASELKSSLSSLAHSTKRGFSANAAEKRSAQKICEELSKLNPTPEPASPFYEQTQDVENSNLTLCGKWTLLYTDAPDITSLEGQGGILPSAKLGRIGQECVPPFIKNVIEWQRPDWAKSLPFSGSDDSRIFQKVVCEATSNPDQPLKVDLKLVGLEVLGSDDSKSGGPAQILEKNPLELKGFLKAPFGSFRVLYLDEDMRIIKTVQNFLAVNIREEAWF